MITISNNPAPSKTADVRIFDTPVLNLPEDLYIPPQAFAIWLEQFAGPLDFLLYLVKKNNFDLTETAILSYISELDEAYFELAGDYLLMASTLIAIKSELLLPQSKVDDDEISPKARLIRRLEEYAQIKEAARRIDGLLRLERDVFLAFTSMPSPEAMQKQLPKYSPELLFGSLIHMKIRPEAITHTVQADSVPLSQRIASITRLISEKGVSTFAELIDKSQGKIGIVVSFVAVLELMKRGLIGFDEANSGKLNPTKNDTYHDNQNGQDLTKQSLHWLH